MSIESIKDMTDFLLKNEDLIREIQETVNPGVDIVQSFAVRLDKNRKESEALLKKINNIKFEVSSKPDVKQKQAMLLKEIGEVSKKIQMFKNIPSLTTNLFLQRSALYLELGNTYNDLVGQIVTFTQDEVDQLRELLRRAALDAQARQRLASILDGAVNISKFALKVALKLA